MKWKRNTITLKCLVLLLFLLILKSQPSKQRRKKVNSNEIPVRDSKDSSTLDMEISSEPVIDVENIVKLEEEIFTCPPCTMVSMIKSKDSNNNNRGNQKRSLYEKYIISSLKYYFTNDLYNTYACLCQALDIQSTSTTFLDGSILHAILENLSQSKRIKIDPNCKDRIKGLIHDSSDMFLWEFLGPFPVGKLEMDGDPTFAEYEPNRHENDPIGSYLVNIPSNKTFYSELVSNGEISWTILNSNYGQVDIHFPNIQWQSLGLGVESSGVYEFQGWLRSYTFVKDSSQYAINCQGVHTVYVRNDNRTRLVTGDVYRSGLIQGIIDLKIGPVALLIPIRAVGQTSIKCQILSKSMPSIEVYSPTFVPSLVELSSIHGGKSNQGVFLSNIFSLPVANTQSYPVTLQVSLESIKALDGMFDITLIQMNESNHIISSSNYDTSPKNSYISSSRSSESSSIHRKEIMVAPGQTTSIPLQIIRLSEDPTTSSNTVLSFVPCRKKSIFTIVIRPSRGEIVKIPLELQCRSIDLSILVSYINHDGSVSQAGLLFPLTSSKGRSYNNIINQTQLTNIPEKSSPINLYPYILSLHGTGINPGNQADSYKTMPKSEGKYIFGVKDFFVITPSRTGAHNWEAIGDLSAQSSIPQIQKYLQNFPMLPQLDSEFGVIAGHSMGGHGAWIGATNHPNSIVCAAPSSSWIRKEQYSKSNAFFETVDTQNPYIDPGLKAILEKAMTEFHVDRMVSNMKFMNVNIRVGGADTTTHPWYSRRMYRILKEYHQINVTYHEFVDKQHWWWDTYQSNDGGVMNDAIMRDFFATCRIKSDHKWLDFHMNRSDLTHHTNVSENDIVHKSSYNSTQDSYKSSVRCMKGFVLSVINPASQYGLCGIRILQQYQSFGYSSASIDFTESDWMSIEKIYSEGGVSTIISNDGNTIEGTENTKNNLWNDVVFSEDIKRIRKICHIKTSNVYRLKITKDSQIYLHNVERLFINDIDMPMVLSNIKSSEQSIDVCIDNIDPASNISPVRVCEKTMKEIGIHEKSLINYGPVRHIYNRPICIVYGTPSQTILRVALRDYAMYLANSMYTSHHISVQVMTDLEYKSVKIDWSNDKTRDIFPNVIMIGGPQYNKAMYKLCFQKNEDEASHPHRNKNSNSNSNSNSKSGDYEIECLSPVTFSVGNNRNISNISDTKSEIAYHIGPYKFINESIIYTFPIARSVSTNMNNRDTFHREIAMGVCIHSATLEGWNTLTRVAWPVVPPMVRAPFANYLPDYMVTQSSLWYKGFGGVVIAGYWDMKWKYDKTQTYVK